LCGIGIVFGFLAVLNQLQVPFYLYYPRTTETVLVSATIDAYVFVASTLVVPISLLLHFRRKSALSSRFGISSTVAVILWIASVGFITSFTSLALLGLLISLLITAADLVVFSSSYNMRWQLVASDILVGGLTILCLVEAAPVFYWFSSSINPLSNFGESSSILETNLTYSFYGLSLLFLLMLLFSWVWVPTGSLILSRFRVQQGGLTSRPEVEPKKFERRIVAACVDLLAIIGVVVFFYPYMAGQTWLVGSDVYPNYYYPLSEVSSLPPVEALTSLVNFSSLKSAWQYHAYHPAYVAILYFVKFATGASPFVVVKFAPLVFAILLSVTTFWLLLDSFGDLKLALTGGVCTLFWIPATLGIFSALQSNWAALVLWTLYLLVMLRRLRRGGGRVNLLLQFVLSFGILVIHPWTWGVFAATLIIFSVLNFRRGEVVRRSLSGLFSSLGLPFIVGIAGAMLLPSLRQNLLSTLSIYSLTLSDLSLFSLFLNALSSFLMNDASFLSPTILLVTILGSVFVMRRSDLMSRYLLAWTVAWCIGSLLVAPSGFNPHAPSFSETDLWRTLYDSPLPFLLTFGIYGVVDISKRLAVSLNPSNKVLETISLCGVILLASVPLFLFDSALIRLGAILSAIILLGMMTRVSPTPRMVRILVAFFLVLVVLNGAFRSLYPLLLNPHNLFQ